KILADVFHPDIAHQCSRQESGFRQDLKAVADAENKPALIREIAYGGHNRRELCERARAEVVPIREATGQDDGIESFQRCLFMPDKFHRLFDDRLDCVITIVIAVAARYNNHAEFHDHSQTIRYSSMTGFVKTSFARRSRGPGFPLSTRG